MKLKQKASDINFRFISIPNTGTASCFLELKRRSICGDLPAEIDRSIELVSLADAKEAISGIPDSVAVVFTEPAERLYRAYLAQQGDDKSGSFADFYRKPVRRNLYARLMGNIPVEKLGFIGLSSHPVKSSELLKRRLDIDSNFTDRFLHHEINLVGEEERAEIKKLHYRDYEIYDQLKAEFDKRWSAFSPTFFHAGDVPPVDKQKKVYIHVGPPKTGTSAIQAWLLKHSAELQKAGIFYPTHVADENDISSGNFHHLMSHDGEQFIFDRKKAGSLITQFNNSAFDTLLLSSEHFNYCIVDLIRYFPSATYVFYIRHPLLSHESHYHQSVKRHNKTDKFTPQIRWRFTALESIVSVVAEFKVNISYRFYSNSLFEGGSLISDFSGACELPIGNTNEGGTRINTSYSFEALELMRKFNQFADDSLKRELDIWFQRKSINNAKFTLYSADDIAEAQKKLHLRIAPIHLNENRLSVEKLSALLNDLPEVQYVNQGALSTSALELLKVLKSEKPALAYRLYTVLKHNNKAFDDKETVMHSLKPGLYGRWSLHIREILNKIVPA